jgi:hypothetical protein
MGGGVVTEGGRVPRWCVVVGANQPRWGEGSCPQLHTRKRDRIAIAIALAMVRWGNACKRLQEGKTLALAGIVKYEGMSVGAVRHSLGKRRLARRLPVAVRRACHCSKETHRIV